MDCCNYFVEPLYPFDKDCYDTANGMDCCNDKWKCSLSIRICYDTANGMDCCNLHRICFHFLVN